MSFKRLLITGGSGLLALNWAFCMRDKYEIHLAVHKHNVNLEGTTSVYMNLDSPEVLVKQLEVIEPDLVVHTAGLTSVDACETYPEMAQYANATLAKHVAVATAKLGIKLIHISTDHLFAGGQPRVSEEDEPKPLNIYARTKLEAERLVRDTNSKALIVRTNFFGWGHMHRQSFSDWIIQSLRTGRKITMFDDVFFTPILADCLALATHEVIAEDASGVYNIVGEERISKYDFAHEVATSFGLPHSLITRGQIGKAMLPASRPRDMSLDNAKVRKLLRRQLGSVKGFLEELNQQELRGRTAELKNAVMEK